MTDETSERRKVMPEWVDRQRLMVEACLSDETVDAWVRQGLLPEPKKRGGKLMWRWATVDDYLENGNPDEQPSQDNDRVVKMRGAMQAASRRKS